MDRQFISLPPELREKVLKSCSRKDWHNVSLCCKQLYEDVKPLLWSFVNINWNDLTGCIRDKLNSVKFTFWLDITTDATDKLDNLETEEVAANFNSIVANCDRLRLRCLTLYNFLPEDGLKMVAKTLPDIKLLSLFGIERNCWNHITRFTHLKRLEISHCNIEDNHFRGIEVLQCLIYVDVGSCSGVTGEFLKMCTKLPNLATLTFEYNAEEYYDEPLGKFPSLTMLVLTCPLLPDFLSGAEENLDKLQIMRIAEAYIDDINLFCISKIALLEELYLDICPDITDEGILHVSDMTSLKRLAVCRCNVTDEGLRYISKMETLKSLIISRSNGITDVGLSYLCHLPVLTSLDIDSCENITDQGLKHIANMPSLESLSIQHGLFTNEGLWYMKGMSKLKEFNFSNNPGIDEEFVREVGLPTFYPDSD